MTPRRIQRKRTKGWRMPPETVCVTRGTKWGNIFRVGQIGVPDASTAVALYRREILTRGGSWQDLRFDLPELRGKNLACWCPLVDKDGNRVPCHADVLLRLANKERTATDGNQNPSH